MILKIIIKNYLYIVKYRDLQKNIYNIIENNTILKQ